MRHLMDDARRSAEMTLDAANRALKTPIARNPRHRRDLTTMVNDALGVIKKHDDMLRRADDADDVRRRMDDDLRRRMDADDNWDDDWGDDDVADDRRGVRRGVRVRGYRRSLPRADMDDYGDDYGDDVADNRRGGARRRGAGGRFIRSRADVNDVADDVADRVIRRMNDRADIWPGHPGHMPPVMPRNDDVRADVAPTPPHPQPGARR